MYIYPNIYSIFFFDLPRLSHFFVFCIFFQVLFCLLGFVLAEPFVYCFVWGYSFGYKHLIFITKEYIHLPPVKPNLIGVFEAISEPII